MERLIGIQDGCIDRTMHRWKHFKTLLYKYLSTTLLLLHPYWWKLFIPLTWAQIHTIAQAGVVGEAQILGLQERWLALHLLPQRQHLLLIILQTLLVHKLQPQFLKWNIQICRKILIHYRLCIVMNHPPSTKCDRWGLADLLPLHDLCQSVRLILWWKTGKVHLLLLQSLIIQPQSKHPIQPAEQTISRSTTVQQL